MSRATIESTAEKIIILCFTINILPSFAESRQIKVCSWRIVSTPSDSCKRVAETNVCSLRFAQRQGASKGVFLSTFSALKKWRSGAAAIRRKLIINGEVV